MWSGDLKATQLPDSRLRKKPLVTCKTKPRFSRTNGVSLHRELHGGLCCPFSEYKQIKALPVVPQIHG